MRHYLVETSPTIGDSLDLRTATHPPDNHEVFCTCFTSIALPTSAFPFHYFALTHRNPTGDTFEEDHARARLYPFFFDAPAGTSGLELGAAVGCVARDLSLAHHHQICVGAFIRRHPLRQIHFASCTTSSTRITDRYTGIPTSNADLDMTCFLSHECAGCRGNDYRDRTWA